MKFLLSWPTLLLIRWVFILISRGHFLSPNSILTFFKITPQWVINLLFLLKVRLNLPNLFRYLLPKGIKIASTFPRLLISMLHVIIGRVILIFTPWTLHTSLRFLWLLFNFLPQLGCTYSVLRMAFRQLSCMWLFENIVPGRLVCNKTALL